MKKLEKILLINWRYFSKQYIELGDINFLTGLNGAGKTTVIDALQIVLLGETNSHNFNRAASDRQKRTLDGYLWGDEGDHHPMNRRGKDFSSYIVCQFCDTQKGMRFVMGIVFDCYKDGNRRERFFAYDGSIPPDGFTPKGRPLEIADLRMFLQKTYGTRFEMFDTQKAYREFALAKWNVHNPALMHLMKRAVSFQPIRDIEEFITQNICDVPDKPDIEAMQENIRYYKRQETLLQQEEEKKAALVEIQEAYTRWTRDKELSILHLYICRRAGLVSEEEMLQELHETLSNLKAEMEEIRQQNERKEGELREKKQEITALEQELYANDSFLKQHQWEEKRDIYRKQRKLEEERVHQLTSVMNRQYEGALRQGKSLEGLTDSLFFDLDRENQALVELWKGSQSLPLEEVVSYASTLGEMEDAFLQKAYGLEQQLYRKIQDKENLLKEEEERLQKLYHNIKDYPKELLTLKGFLQETLKAQGMEDDVRILAEELEIDDTDEAWRGAIEGYLHTQKFYLLVPPQSYDLALKTYNGHRRQFGNTSYGLIDVESLRQKAHIRVHPKSLAVKVKTAHAGARLYMDYILGNVVACDRVEELRQYGTSITKEGMLYKGFVARPLLQKRMENCYIGSRAIALQIAKLEASIKDNRDYVTKWRPLYQKVHQLKAYMPQHIVDTVFVPYVETMHQIEVIDQNLMNIEKMLSSLDIGWLYEQKEKIARKKAEVEKDEALLEMAKKKAWDVETGIRRKEDEEIPHHELLCEEARHKLETFSESFVEKEGNPAFEKVAHQKEHNLGKIKTDYERSHLAYQNRMASSWQQLREVRMSYVNRYNAPFESISHEDNSYFDEKLAELEESKLPSYKEKIHKARMSALEQFQNDFLAHLKASIDQVTSRVKQLNKALHYAKFGTDSYQFKVGKNPTFGEYYDMIMAPELMEGDGGLFASAFQDRYGSLIDQLFQQIVINDDDAHNARRQSELQENIERFTDFRTYLHFDLETTDEEGRKQLLSKTIHTKSGGETQTPFYIAIFASFAQLYQVNNSSQTINNTMRLVVFDEAFNKMDSERIVESIALLRRLGLQAIICTPPEKAADIGQEVDRILLVSRDKKSMQVTKWEKSIDAN